MNHSDIDLAYVQLWGRFRTACSSARRIVRPRDIRGFESRTAASKTVVVKSLLYFPEWPYKPSSRKRVHILLRSHEEFSCSRAEMMKSTVQIAYFRFGDSDRKAEPLLSLHYDFEAAVQPAHPVFHAQFGVVDFSAAECDAISFPKKIDSHKGPLYGRVRIPTPYMNLGSVLLMLAADHWPPSSYEEFLEGVRSNPTVRWNASCPSLISSLGDCEGRGYLHSHHWYPPASSVSGSGTR